MSFEAHQRPHLDAEIAQLPRPAEIRQVDDEAGRHDVGADLAQEVRGGDRGAARCDEVVDENDPLLLAVIVCIDQMSHDPA